jgi:hypothetical protein
MTPEQRYEDLVDEFAGVDGVVPPQGGSGFGRDALRFRRKIFAFPAFAGYRARPATVPPRARAHRRR